MPKIGYGYALYTGSPSSLPSDISGLSLWLKADAGVNTIQKSTLDGTATTSSVTSWEDQSGSVKNALPESYNPSINAGDSNPTFVSSVVNNKPALYFDATQYLKTANIFNGTTPRTMFAVYNVNDIRSVNAICGIANEFDNVEGTNFALYARSDLNSNPYFSSNTYDLTGPAFQLDIWKLASVDYNGTTTNLYSNGSLANSGDLSIDTSNSSFFIGADYYTEDPEQRTYYGGYICEILVYNKALSKTERQQVEGYLNAKYAIY